MTTNIRFTKIHVEKAEDAERFYADALGLRTLTRIEGGEGEYAFQEIIMALPGTTLPAANFILMCYPNQPCPKPGEAITGFTVANLDAAMDRAVKAGATVEVPPIEAVEHGLRLAFLLDPQGHRFELLEEIGG